MSEARPMFVGRTRFSLYVPGNQSFRASSVAFGSAEEYKEWLWSEKRLDQRCDIFLTMTLPQIAVGAKEYPIRHIVSYPSELPRRYKALLQAAADEYDFLFLDRVSEGGKHSVPGSGNQSAEDTVRQCVRSLDGQEGVVFGYYRIDDDDVLSDDYWPTVAPYLTEQHVGWIVSPGLGLNGVYRDSSVYHLRLRHHPMASPGLLEVCAIDHYGSLIRPHVTSHSRSDRKNPVILDSRIPLWIRTIDGYTDSRAGTFADPVAEAVVVDSQAVAGELPDDASLQRFSRIFHRLTAGSPPDSFRSELTPFDIPITDLPREIPIPSRPGGNIRVVLRAQGPRSNKLLLLGARLCDDEGCVMDAQRASKLEIEGLGLSRDPKLGWFRYLSGGPGGMRHVVDFALPSGVRLDALMFRRWDKAEQDTDRLLGGLLAYSIDDVEMVS